MLKEIESKIKPIVELCSLKFDSLSFYEKDDTSFLEINVDKDGGVSTDDLDLVTEKINEYLDNEDPIKEEYTLLIQSVGVERDIKPGDEKKYIGEYVYLKTDTAIYLGTLKSVKDSNVTIHTNKNKDITVNLIDCLEFKKTIKF